MSKTATITIPINSTYFDWMVRACWKLQIIPENGDIKLQSRITKTGRTIFAFVPTPSFAKRLRDVEEP